VQVFHDSSGLLSTYRYFNPETNAISDEGPRLDPLFEWERIEVGRTGDDPDTFQSFKSKITGEILTSDSRLLPEAIKARGGQSRDIFTDLSAEDKQGPGMNL
jgi:hypothetical protein